MTMIEVWTIRLLSHVFISLTLVIVFVAWKGDGIEPHQMRADWRKHSDPSTLCEATILQWTKACGDTWIDRQLIKDNNENN